MEQMFDFCQGMCYTEKTAAQARKLTVLARIAGAFRRAEVTWALGASGLLYFHGQVPDFRDLDLMVLLPDAGAPRKSSPAWERPCPSRPMTPFTALPSSASTGWTAWTRT